MKVLRYSAIAAVAIFAAACGDKVTVAGPTAVTLTSTTTTTTTTTPVAPGKINSIAVAPAAVTLTIGQAVTLVAAVNADPGIATTVTWSSSDATKASVSTAGLVTALAATPGVAICATSTVNVGVKGCASAVVVAASATVPATATIQGVYQTNTATPITPSAVFGSVPVLVNVDPGTETLTKIYLKIGTVVADSQVFTAAQSAALRNAVETANETGAQAAGVDMGNALQSIMLTANTAAYNATTGAVSYANGTAALSVQLFVAGNTAARSTATYSTNLTLNNTDVINGAWTFPSTSVTANDINGYNWRGFGGGNATLTVIPVLYSGKTVTSATVKFPVYASSAAGGMTAALSYCDITAVSTGGCSLLPATADTAFQKVVTVASAGSFPVTFGLYDRELQGGTTTYTVAGGIAPTIMAVYSDGSNYADAAFANATALTLRIDNKGPTALDPTIASTATGNVGSSSAPGALRSALSFTYRTALAADSLKLFATPVADVGVSAGATMAAPQGTSFKVFRNAGGTGATVTDTVPVFATEVTALATTETGYYCYRVKSYDALGNASRNNKEAQVKVVGATMAKSCLAAAGSGQFAAATDNTVPVLAWVNNGLQYAMSDTASASDPGASAQLYWSITDANTVTATAKTTLNVYSTGSRVASCVKGTLAGNACGTWTPTATNSVYSLTDGTTSASIAIAATGQTIITVGATDLAGNPGTAITRVVVRAVAAPTVTTPAGVNASLGADITMSTYGTDPVAVSAFNANMAYVGAATAGTAITAIFPTDFSTTGLDARIATTSYTKFLNVALAPTVTAAPAIIAFQPDANNSQMSALSYLALRPTFGAYAAGPSNLIGSAGAIVVSYADQTAAGGVANTAGQSLFVGAGSGLEYTNALAVTTTSTNIGPNTLAAASTTASATFSMSYSYYRLQSLVGATVMGTTYQQSKNFCQQARGVTHVTQVSATNVSAATPFLSVAALGVPATSIQANNAPTVVDAYITVGGEGASRVLLKVGTATKVSTATSALTGTGTAAQGDCAQIITDTWSYVLTPTAQRLVLPYFTGASASNLFFAIKASSGRELVFSAPSTAWTYRP